MKPDIEAFIGIDEVDTTERILNKMTDPERIEEQEWKKNESRRVHGLKSRHSL